MLPPGPPPPPPPITMPDSKEYASSDEKRLSVGDNKAQDAVEVVSVKELDTAAQLAAVDIGVLDHEESERIKCVLHCDQIPLLLMLNKLYHLSFVC